MNETTYRIANIFGLDTNKAQHTVAILDALNGIEKLDEFVVFCRDKKHGIEYASKTEKLDMLSAQFKSLEEDKRLALTYDKAKSYAENLSHKVRECRTFVEEKECNFVVVVVGSEKYFKDHELKALKEVGSVMLVIEYSRQNKLKSEIEKLYMSKIKQKSLGCSGNKDVKALLKNTIKGM